ncbi:Patched domain-containing protein 3 [Aphelenchoides bicaudatus]|nr:Patched domain-containing protein 3 [Aphelenchoides bicaudatus]
MGDIMEAKRELDLENPDAQSENPWRYHWKYNWFEHHGRFTSRLPYVCLFMSLFFLWPAYGTIWMNVKDNIRDGYTPLNAPSRMESDALKAFYNTTGEPQMTALIITAKDGGSLLRLDHLSEAVKLEKNLMNDFQVRLEDGKPFVFNDLCEPYCNLNRPIEVFYHGLMSEWESHKQGYQPDSSTNLVYPIATVNGYKIPIQRLFFGINRKPYNISDTTKTDAATRFTNMESASIIMLLFRGDVDTPLAERRLAEWEMSVWHYAYEEFKSDKLQIEVIGHRVLDQEMIREGKRMTPFFASGFTLVGIFVAVAIIVPSAMQGDLNSDKLWIVAVALGCPILAILSAFGAMTLMNMRINSFLLVMPTLVLGIGVDDGFLLIHSWLRHHHLTPQMRLTAVLVDVGPSMTITTITNVLSFAIGWFSPTPEIQLFCFGTMLALAIVYLFHLFLFAPMLIISDQWVTKKTKSDNEELELSRFPSQKPSAHSLTSSAKSWFVFGVLIALFFYWILFGYNMLQIVPRLDASKILPKDSRIQRPNTILHDYIWREYQAVNVIVNKAFRIENEDDRKWLDELVGEFESLPSCLGPEFTMLWTREYQEYFYKDLDFFDLIFGAGEDVSSGESVPGNKTEKPLDSSKLPSFLESPFHKHWKGFIRLAPDNRTISKFWFSVGYTNVTGWGDRIKFVQAWRAIADRYPQLNVTTWEPSMFVDQMLGLNKVAMQTTVLTWSCMAIVCAIFIRNFGTVVIASASILSICLGVIGSLSMLGYDLDPVTVAALLMSIGLSVDYTAHTTSHFQRHRVDSKSTLSCINQTLNGVAWPMLQSAISTVLCVLPLYFSFAYTTRVFFTTICLVTVIGLLHGIVVVPCVFLFVSYLRGEEYEPEKVLSNAYLEAPIEKKLPLDFDDITVDVQANEGKSKLDSMEHIDAESTRL